MHLDRRFLIIVGTSLTWGLIVSLLFYRMATAGRRPVAEKPMIVAVEPLAPGAAIEAREVKVIRVPVNLFPKGGYSKVEEVVGRPVISSIESDEPILESRLAAIGSGFGVAPMIPTGMRAVSVRVNDVAGVAGFVLPGMRVDVLVTGRSAGKDDTFTATVLQNVTVLSAGQTVQTDGKSQSMSVPVVTLLVDPLQAESLTLAASEGHIQLVLRNSSDQKVETTDRRQWRDLYSHEEAAEQPPVPRPAVTVSQPVAASVRRVLPVAPAPAPHASAAVAPEPAAVDTIVLIRGNQKTVETFPSDARSRGGSQ
jgi:pilus assembly protein CpaB